MGEVTKYQIDKYKGINFVLYEDYKKLQQRIEELEKLKRAKDRIIGRRDAENKRLKDAIDAYALRVFALEDIFHNIDNWCKAYPLEVFPEPDFKKAHKVLKENGMTVDAISASAMRHIINGINDYVQQALNPEEKC